MLTSGLEIGRKYLDNLPPQAVAYLYIYGKSSTESVRYTNVQLYYVKYKNK